MPYFRMRKAISREFCNDGSPPHVILWRAEIRCRELPDLGMRRERGRERGRREREEGREGGKRKERVEGGREGGG